jgi:hypothetical protein
MWAVVTLPLLIVGFIALAITGAKIGELSHHAHANLPGSGPRPQASEVGTEGR